VAGVDDVGSAPTSTAFNAVPKQPQLEDVSCYRTSRRNYSTAVQKDEILKILGGQFAARVPRGGESRGKVKSLFNQEHTEYTEKTMVLRFFPCIPCVRG